MEHLSIFLPIVAAYLLCAVLTYGLELADSQRTFGCGRFAWGKYESDKRDARQLAMLGPLGLVRVLWMLAKHRRFHGLMFRSPYRRWGK